MRPDDVDVAEIYDCYSYTLLAQLEDYGFCGKGEGGPFIQDVGIQLGQGLPGQHPRRASRGGLHPWLQPHRRGGPPDPRHVDGAGARRRGRTGDRGNPRADQCRHLDQGSVTRENDGASSYHGRNARVLELLPPGGAVGPAVRGLSSLAISASADVPGMPLAFADVGAGRGPRKPFHLHGRYRRGIRRPPAPGGQGGHPFALAIVELPLDDPVRMVTDVDTEWAERLEIGMPMRVVFEQVSDEIHLPRFVPDQSQEEE